MYGSMPQMSRRLRLQMVARLIVLVLVSFLLLTAFSSEPMNQFTQTENGEVIMLACMLGLWSYIGLLAIISLHGCCPWDTESAWAWPKRWHRAGRQDRGPGRSYYGHRT
jgi:hypothetical protein